MRDVRIYRAHLQTLNMSREPRALDFSRCLVIVAWSIVAIACDSDTSGLDSGIDAETIAALDGDTQTENDQLDAWDDAGRDDDGDTDSDSDADTEDPDGSTEEPDGSTEEPDGSIEEPARAFPGAQGFGTTTRGAYSGSPTPEVLHVTSLADSGEGSLREAILHDGPRIVVFDVGGTIHLEDQIHAVGKHYLTIAGQTAPGDGINITSEKRRALFFKDTHDVIVRGLRIRPAGVPQGITMFGSDEVRSKTDTFRPSHHIVVDHCSISWTSDESITVFRDADDITISYCLIGEPIPPPGSVHRTALIVGPGSERISVHHNLFTQSKIRNPLFGGGDNADIWPGATQCEDVNNYTYNSGWGSFAVGGNATFTGAQPQDIAVVGSYLQAGPNSSTWGATHIIRADRVDDDSQIYAHDVINMLRTSDDQDDWDIFHREENPELSVRVESWPFETSIVDVDSVWTIRDELLDGVGATAPMRDATDARMVADVRAGDVGWVDSVADIPGGYPSYRHVTGPTDTDLDGMPDEWEDTHGLDSTYPDDTHDDDDGDGYSNLEEYINSFF